jgi:hypothetical protein
MTPQTTYVAALCRMVGKEFVPYDSKQIQAPNDDEAVRKAIEWRVNSITTIDDRTWLQVVRDGKAIYSKEIGRL